MAIDNFDFESFEYLLSQMIQLQNGFESAHLVDSWLHDALRLGLNIKPLFESRIMTQRIDRENFQNAEEFYDFHSNPATMTQKYDKGITEFMYSDTAYIDLFGKLEDRKELAKVKHQAEQNGRKYTEVLRHKRRSTTLRQKVQTNPM